MIDFGQIVEQDTFTVFDIIKNQESGILSRIEQLLNEIGFKHSDLFCDEHRLNVLDGGGLGDYNTPYNIVPYYVFMKIFSAYGKHLIDYYDGSEMPETVYEDFKKYVEKINDKLKEYDNANYDMSQYPKLAEYDEILNRTSYEIDPSMPGFSRSKLDIFSVNVVRRYPFNLIYPVINNTYFYLYHNLHRLAMFSNKLTDVSLFTEYHFGENFKHTVTPSGFAYTKFNAKFFNLLNDPRKFVKNNKIVKNIILDFCSSNDDITDVKMIVEQDFLKDSFLYYLNEIRDVHGLDFYDFYLTDRMEERTVIFNVDLTKYGIGYDYPTHINYIDIYNYCEWLKSIMHFSNINICFIKHPDDYVSAPDSMITTIGSFETTDEYKVNEILNEKINNALGIHCCCANVQEQL